MRSNIDPEIIGEMNRNVEEEIEEDNEPVFETEDRISILDIFPDSEETGNSNIYNTICPSCNLQGGRTSGFKLFLDTNTGFCHSSGKHFSLLEAYALKKKFIKCLDGRETGEKRNVLEGETFKQVLDEFKGEFGSRRLVELKKQLSIKLYDDENSFLIKGKNGFFSNIQKISEELVNKHNFKTIFGKKSEDVYIFDGRIYTTEKARETIKVFCEKAVSSHCNTRVVSEVLEKVKRLTAVDKSFFERISLDLIPLENGIYSIKRNELIEFNPDCPFRFIHPIEFDKTAKCPVFDKFITETILPEDIPVIQEWFGFCFVRKYLIKKGMIFKGVKDTGKTILLKALISLIGDSNTSGISLQRITGEDKFALSSLYNKHLNAFDDLSSADLANGGGFKVVTGGGYITAEYKFGDSFTFLNFAKQLFACNSIPPIKDENDRAYLERWIPIVFYNQMKEEEQDLQLSDKIDLEKSGIFNWAMEGLRRLLQNRRFSYEKSKDEIDKIMTSSDPLKRFANDCLIEKTGSKMTKEEMFELYSFWANISGFSRFSKEQLGRRLENSIKYIVAMVGAKERYWKNVDLNRNSSFFKDLDTKSLDALDTFKKTIRQNVSMDNDDNNYYKIFQEPSKASKVDDNSLVLDEFEATEPKKRRQKPKSDRELQFWEAPECSGIVEECTKEQTFNWIKANPSISFIQMDKSIGLGSLRYVVELLNEGLIVKNGEGWVSK